MTEMFNIQREILNPTEDNIHTVDSQKDVISRKIKKNLYSDKSHTDCPCSEKRRML